METLPFTADNIQANLLPEQALEATQTAAQTRLVQGPAALEWLKLEDKFHELTHVVPLLSEELERTTVLTWIYRNNGILSFDQLSEMVGGDQHKSIKKKQARRALRGLVKIGAVSLAFNATTYGDDDVEGEVESVAESGAVIGKKTEAHLTRNGMTWLRRAWNARFISVKSGSRSIAWVHDVYLQEEEDGKGNEPYWIERLNTYDEKNSLAPKGEVSGWMSSAVSSVFDLSREFLACTSTHHSRKV